MNAIPEFTGPESIGPEFTGTAALTLRVSGEGVAIDPAAGRITLSAGSEKSISMPRASRLKSSITLNNRILRPSDN